MWREDVQGLFIAPPAPRLLPFKSGHQLHQTNCFLLFCGARKAGRSPLLSAFEHEVTCDEACLDIRGYVRIRKSISSFGRVAGKKKRCFTEKSFHLIHLQAPLLSPLRILKRTSNQRLPDPNPPRPLTSSLSNKAHSHHYTDASDSENHPC